MINCRTVNEYCCEDPRLIENYEKAVNDKTQTWDIHHRFETDLGLSMDELKEQGKYYNVPASELIFLTHVEHCRLHNNLYEKKGKEPWNKGKKMSKEFCINCSEGHKGKIPWNKGMTKEEMKNYKKQ